MIGVLATAHEAEGGVGGAAGMKSEGIHAADATMDMIRTVVGTEPKKGFTSDATWCQCG
jgi:hypothetical protein